MPTNPCLPGLFGLLLLMLYFLPKHLNLRYILLMLYIAPLVNAVTCNQCKDTIPGCAGGDDCPLLKTVAANRAELEAMETGFRFGANLRDKAHPRWPFHEEF